MSFDKSMQRQIKVDSPSVWHLRPRDLWIPSHLVYNMVEYIPYLFAFSILVRLWSMPFLNINFQGKFKYNDSVRQDKYSKRMNGGIVDSNNRANLSHRIPSHQLDQLIKQHKNKKQCGARYKLPSFIHIHILLSVYQLRHTCTIKLVIYKKIRIISIKIISNFSVSQLVDQNVIRWECAAPSRLPL